MFWEELPQDRASSNDTIWGQLAAEDAIENAEGGENVNLDKSKFEDIFVVVPGQKIEKSKSTQPQYSILKLSGVVL